MCLCLSLSLSHQSKQPINQSNDQPPCPGAGPSSLCRAVLSPACLMMFYPVSRSNFMKTVFRTDFSTLIRYHRQMSLRHLDGRGPAGGDVLKCAACAWFACCLRTCACEVGCACKGWQGSQPSAYASSCPQCQPTAVPHFLSWTNRRRWMSYGTILLALIHSLLYLIEWGAAGELGKQLEWQVRARVGLQLAVQLSGVGAGQTAGLASRCRNISPKSTALSSRTLRRSEANPSHKPILRNRRTRP